MNPHLYISLLHEGMNDKTGIVVTTSVTLIDVHDLARSSRTFGAERFFVSHPSPTMRTLVRSLQSHWGDGFGARYNPDRKDALELLDVVANLDEAIHKIDTVHGRLPKLIATSAINGPDRVPFAEMRDKIFESDEPYMLLIGTGWGMGDALLERADYFLEPIAGFGDYNHLSVRSATAILLSRLMG